MDVDKARVTELLEHLRERIKYLQDFRVDSAETLEKSTGACCGISNGSLGINPCRRFGCCQVSIIRHTFGNISGGNSRVI